jgi:chromosome segregation ATPase
MARLETQVQALRDDLRELSEEASEERKELHELMRAMRSEITHYKGVIGGIALVISGIGIVLGALKAWFLK